MALKKINQFGNFVLSHDAKKGVVSVRTVSGFWSLNFRNDHLMYGAFLKYGTNKDLEGYFEHLFCMWYLMTQGMPDGKCLEGLAVLCEDWFKRLGDSPQEISKEEDDAIVSEIAKAEEVSEEASRE